jgi:NAD(P)-dependent dehydrogenase (short-subunit alcohol dehydrogenase family)
MIVTTTKKTALVTGANAGLGYNSCRFLVTKHNFKRVILACRNKARGETAIAKLVQETGNDASTFELLLMDTTDAEACKNAAVSVSPDIDVVIGGTFP